MSLGLCVKQLLMSSIIEDKERLENERKKSFWYNLSTAELIGMVVLHGLGSAVAGYVGTWVILWYGGLALWYGGLAIFILVGWLILGFADEKQKASKNNK